MDSGSSCEVIYEHCFLKLKPSIRSFRVDSKIPLVRFLGEHSCPLREVPLEVTVGESPYTRTKTLNFVIVRSNSPYNLLLIRTAMLKMGIVVSMIHAAIKFHTPCGIGTTYDDMKGYQGTSLIGGKPSIRSIKLLRVQALELVNTKKLGLAPERNDKELQCKCGGRAYKGFRLKCFLDAYKGYHQIQMAEGDEDNTTFFTGKGVFCYRKMPFGLKNAGATYQSASEEDMQMDIQETFDRLRSINMKLNPKKCSFGVKEGPFLGHLITKQGIKANPSKVKTITDLKPPRTLKEIQSLNESFATNH
ncbi:hypothetical protein Tco_0695448 [Tanacetum coccineum]